MSNSKFAICLFKKTIDSLDASELVVGKDLEKVRFTGETEKEILLYQRKSELSIPAWVEIVKGFGNFKGNELKTGSSGAILFIKIGKRVMGCCFGTSVANINRGNIESNFGLGVVYQKMLKNQTKSISSFTLAHNPITNNKSSTIPTSKSNFNIDDYLENITELSGYFYKKNTKLLIKGKEFFSSTSPKKLTEIIETCKFSLKDYEASLKDENFKRLTSTRWVKDKETVKELDKELCSLMNEKSDKVFLIDYENIEDISDYRLTPKGEENKELNIDVLYESFKVGKKIDLVYLKNRRIYPQNDSSDALANWTLYKCLFTEFNIGKDFFILYKGKWYQIEENYLSGLKKFIKDYEVHIDTPSEWNGTESEGLFNKKAAKELKGQCWDKKMYKTKLYNYTIEFCDILTRDFIYHVKKYDGSQLTSHLLMQTTVSAQLLSSDPEIKKWIKNTSNKEFNGVNLLNDDIGYFILLMCKKKDKELSDILPFFSLITMNLTIKRILQLGFKVSIAKV